MHEVGPVLLYTLAGGGIFLVVGLLLLYLARRADVRNWFIQRAPELPIRLVNAADDVWITGEVNCRDPVLLPYFDVPCVYYDYRIEKKVRRTRRRKGKTETYYTWVTDHSESDCRRFHLVDGDASLEIRAEEAEFADLESTGTDYETSRRRHSARYFAPSGWSGAVGLVDDEKLTLGRGPRIPLVVTRRTRKDYIRAIEFSERLKRVFGLLLLWLGIGGMFFAGAGLLGWTAPIRGGQDLVLPIILAAATALVPLFLVWGIYTYNTMVAYRTRTTNAWRLIDIDLQNRYDLVPQLVSVIRGATKHESELLERIARLRSEYLAGNQERRVAQEREAADTVSRVILLQEAYPELESNELFQKLREVLTALEDKIAHDRFFYNENVTEYHDLIQAFPHSLVAGLGGFRTLPLFAIQGDEARVPGV